MPSTSVSTQRKRWAAMGAAATLLTFTAACSAPSQEPAIDAAMTPSVTAEVPDENRAMTDARHYRAAIESAGLSTAMSDDTLHALGDGICQQLSVGTDPHTIADNLRSAALNGANKRSPTGSGGAAAGSAPTDADRAASVFVDAARSAYC
ncbi:hypothetical protein ABH922_002281 [Rhodococcus sp. 27YEA15]|uniref:DUF732 domain-containing protein n=1 Tax=Rhodococcus sp. 27YEA15 TaxID=3156259 RepID=UPI003C7A020C